jgi:anti-sigma factor RsiW
LEKDLMTHPNENVWKAFVDGEVNAAEAARLEAHLNGCDVCQTRVDALRQRAAWVAAQFAPAQNQPTGSTVAQGRSRLE